MSGEPQDNADNDQPAQRVKGRWARLSTSRKAVMVIIVVAILAGASLGVPGLLTVKQQYYITSFNAARAYADHQWYQNLGPRMTGTDAEAQGAEYEMSQMQAAGLKNVHIEEYSIPLFQVKKADVSLVQYGPAGLVPKPLAATKSFMDKVDFVVQGFSGSRSWSNFKSDLTIYDMGNGSDAGSWTNAAGKCGVLTSDQYTANDTALFRQAVAYKLAALAIDNHAIHPEIGYVPIFKGVYLNEGEAYAEIPFFMMSKTMGDAVLSAAKNGSRMRLDFDIPKTDVNVRVVVGDVPGTEKSGKYVMVGAHHDTVYDGPGEVDNTSGTVTVLETARSMAKERPRQTIRFAWFGGEEEGLLGSQAYVAAHSQDIRNNMIFYENCDMTNIDSARGLTGWIGSNDNATVEHYKEIDKLVVASNPKFSKYQMSFSYDTMREGSDQASFLGLDKKVSFGAGSGCYEYHTYLDNITHINSESEALFGEIVGTYAYYMAENY